MKPRKKYVGAEFYVYHNWGDEHDRLKGLDLGINDDRFLFESSLIQEIFTATEKMGRNVYLCESDWRTFVGTKAWLDKHCLRVDNLVNRSFKFTGSNVCCMNSKPELRYENERSLERGEVITIIGHENYHFRCLTQNNVEWIPINSFELSHKDSFKEIL